MPSELSTWKLTEPSLRTATLTRARDVARILPLPFGNPGGAADAHLARLSLITDLCTKSTADSRRSLETLCNSETTSDDRQTYVSLVRMTSELLPKLTDGDPLPTVDFTQAPTTDEQCKDYLSVMSLAAVTENSSYRFALSAEQEMDLLAAVIQAALLKAIPRCPGAYELCPELFKANSEAIFRANTVATTTCALTDSDATDTPHSAWKDHQIRLEALSELYRGKTSEARHETLCYMYDDSYTPDRGLELLIDRANGLDVSVTDGKSLCLPRGFFVMPATVENSEMQLWAFSKAVLEEHESLVGALPEQTRLKATRASQEVAAFRLWASTQFSQDTTAANRNDTEK